MSVIPYLYQAADSSLFKVRRPPTSSSGIGQDSIFIYYFIIYYFIISKITFELIEILIDNLIIADYLPATGQ